MTDLPECRKRRDGPESGGRADGGEMNGQVCHRIAEHEAYSSCIFDRPAEFEPVRIEARPLHLRPQDKLGIQVSEA